MPLPSQYCRRDRKEGKESAGASIKISRIGYPEWDSFTADAASKDIKGSRPSKRGRIRHSKSDDEIKTSPGADLVGSVSTQRQTAEVPCPKRNSALVPLKVLPGTRRKQRLVMVKLFENIKH